MNGLHCLVTGGAGFIGSHLCDALVGRHWSVWCVDDLSLGRVENVAHLSANGLFRFVRLDVLDSAGLDLLFREAQFDAVFHLAANSDIQQGSRDHRLDLRLNFETTVGVLEAMLRHNVRKIFFASTSAVFGEGERALDEEAGPLRPISFYGASKLAAESYASVYANNYGFQVRVLRFPNVVGPRMTHGAVFDFVRRLRADPGQLTVLGDGSQAKPYLHVDDLIRAIMLVWERAPGQFSVFHVGNEDKVTVAEMARICVEEMGSAGIPIRYAGGDRGWVGDVPSFAYDSSKIRRLGFHPSATSLEAVRAAARHLSRAT